MRLHYPAIENLKRGYDFFVLVQTWPSIATEQAAVLAHDWWIFLAVGACVAVLVWGLILFALVRWRRRDASAMPPQFRNNVPLEVTWTAIPLVLVVGLFVYTYRAEASVDALSARPALVVHVNAYRWGWTFRYDGGPVIGGAATSPQLGAASQPPPQMVLPFDRTVRIELTSSDVNHSFWVPDFLFKRDAIPGQLNAFDLRPEKLGTFVGRCAQFCGLDHALMTFTIRVVSPGDFSRWRASASST